MNQSQIKYARARAAAVFAKRTTALRATHTTPAVKLTKAEKLQALCRGNFTINETGSGRYHWYDSVEFAETPETIDTAALELAQAALAEAFRKLEDELVLGDNEAALALLQAFEAEA